jgi:hypothetical protein
MAANMPLIRLYAVVLALLIASCGRPAAVTQRQTETPPTTAFEAEPVEGYSWCQTPGQPIITVTNGQLLYVVPHPDLPGNHSPTAFPATFRPDGSFIGQSVEGTISGQVRGTHLEGSIDGSYQSAIRVIHRVRSDQSEGFVATTARATVSSQRPTASWADRAAARAVSLQEIDRL